MDRIRNDHQNMASVKLRDAAYSEIPEISHVLALSFKDDPIWAKVMHPHRHEYPDDTYLWFLQRFRAGFWDYRWKWLVAVDQDAAGKEVIVGCAQWHRKGKGGQYMDLWWFDPRQFIHCPFPAFLRKSDRPELMREIQSFRRYYKAELD